MPSKDYEVNIADARFSAEDREYLKSPEFRALSPSARIQVAKERLAPKVTAEQIEAKKWSDHEAMMEVYLERERANEVRLAALRKEAEARNRLIRGH